MFAVLRGEVRAYDAEDVGALRSLVTDDVVRVSVDGHHRGAGRRPLRDLVRASAGRDGSIGFRLSVVDDHVLIDTIAAVPD